MPVGFAAGVGGWAGVRATARLLDRADRPTAILALSGALVLGVLEAAAARDIVVLHELGLAGFDDAPRRGQGDAADHDRPQAGSRDGDRRRAPPARR